MGGPTMHPQHVQPGPPLSWISPAAPPASGCVTASVLMTRSSLFLELITALMDSLPFLVNGRKSTFCGGKKKQPRAHQQSEALTRGVRDERSLQPDPAPRGELMAALCVHTCVHVCVHPTLQLRAAPITPKPSGLAGQRTHTLSITTAVSQGQHRLPKSAWGRTRPRGAPRGSPDPAAAPPGSPFLLPWDRSQQHRGTGQGDAAPGPAALPFPPPEPSFNPSTPARCQRCTFCFFFSIFLGGIWEQSAHGVREHRFWGCRD